MRFTRPGLIASFGAALLLSLSLTGSVSAQTIVWKAANAGRAVAFSPDGQTLLAGTQLRRTADGALLINFRLPYNGSGPNAVALSPDGQYAAIGIQSLNQNLDLFSAVNGALLAGRVSAHNNGTTSVDFSPDRLLLASGGRDGTAKLWHLPDMKLVRTLQDASGYRPRVFAVAFSNDGRLLAVGGQAGVSLFRVADGVLIRKMSPVVSTTSVAFSPDGQILAAGSNAVDQYGDCTDCTVKLWRVASAKRSLWIPSSTRALSSTARSIASPGHMLPTIWRCSRKKSRPLIGRSAMSIGWPASASKICGITTVSPEWYSVTPLHSIRKPIQRACPC